MNALNTFANPNAIKPAPFRDYKFRETQVIRGVPPKSVAGLELQ